MKEKVQAFKNELRNYRYYKNEKRKIKEKINLEYYNLANVKAVNPQKQPGTTNEEYLHEKRNEAYERIAELKEKEKEIAIKIKAIDRVLDKIPEKNRKIITELFIEKKDANKICSLYYISKSTLYYRVDVWIEKSLK